MMYVDVTISYDKMAHIWHPDWILIGCPGSIFVSKGFKKTKTKNNNSQRYHTKLFDTLNV